MYSLWSVLSVELEYEDFLTTAAGNVEVSIPSATHLS